MDDLSTPPDTTHLDPKIAKLTMEMFMNNSYYTKYLHASDPSAYKKHKGILDGIEKHKDVILDLTEELLSNPESHFNKVLLESFHQYVSQCIKYIEVRDLEKQASEKSAQDYGGDCEWSDGEDKCECESLS